MSNDVMKLIVHPGIGDISWVISKLSTTGRQFDLVIADDRKTRRSMPLVDMIPCIRSAEYGGMDLYYPLSKVGNAKFSEYEDAQREGKNLFVTANKWLEDGNRLEGFLPDLDTDFHYDLQIPESDMAWAEGQTRKSNRSFGIYTSSAGGIANWRAWGVHEWAAFAEMVYQSFADVTFYLIGAPWDMDMRVPMLDALERCHLPYVDLMGKTSLQKAVALIKHLDYFAGYASGLTIMSDVINRPVLMLYPKHLNRMMGAWPDPANIAVGMHQAHLWDRPIEIFYKVLPQLHRYLD